MALILALLWKAQEVFIWYNWQLILETFACLCPLVGKCHGITISQILLAVITPASCGPQIRLLLRTEAVSLKDAGERQN